MLGQECPDHVTLRVHLDAHIWTVEGMQSDHCHLDFLDANRNVCEHDPALVSRTEMWIACQSYFMEYGQHHYLLPLLIRFQKLVKFC